MLRLPRREDLADDARRARALRAIQECRTRTGERETRSIRGKVRASGRVIYGTAAVFNTRTDIGSGLWLEQIAPGTFSRAIRERQNVAALINHDPSKVLGRVGNNTLTLTEDSRGLQFRCDVAMTSDGDDLLQLAARGDIAECSFGFITPIGGDRWETVTDAGRTRDLRTLLDVDLFDVSAVTFAQYSGTSVETGRDLLDLDDEDECDPDDLDCIDSLVRMGGLPRAALELRSRRQRSTEPIRAISAIKLSDEERELRARAECALLKLECMDL